MIKSGYFILKIEQHFEISWWKRDMICLKTFFMCLALTAIKMVPYYKSAELFFTKTLFNSVVNYR